MLLVMAVVWAWRVWREPRFEGRGVRDWIAQLPDVRRLPDSRRAMQFLGEGAVPYLIEATLRPRKWQNSWLAKVPRRLVNPIVDLRELDDIAGAATRRLEELAREEIERNELAVDPRYPITDQLIPVWKRQLQKESSGRLLSAVRSLGPRATNLAPELKAIWYRLNPSADYWMTITELLAETHDPSLTPALLHWANVKDWVNVRTTPVTWVEVKATAIDALGRNGHVTDQVMSTFRSGLILTNEKVNVVTIAACAQLGVCTGEALARIDEKRAGAPWKAKEASQYCDLIEPILRWRSDTNSAPAAGQIRANLSANATPPGRAGPKRRTTAELLGRAGPAASQFTPALIEMARDPDRDLQIAAIRALRAIDPVEAERILPSLVQIP